MTAMRVVLRVLSTALITAGLVVAIDVALTLIWKEPLSTVYGSIQQDEAEADLGALSEDFLSDQEIARLAAALSGADDATARRLATRLAALYGRQIEPGDAIGRIELSEIGVDAVLLEGTGTATLKRGPGHYPKTALPGAGRTIGVAGHRTTYLAPFRRLNDLERGDEVRVELPYASFSYEVEGERIVAPDAIEVVDDVGYERLVMTACHPLYSAAQRYVVFARLRSIAAP